MSLIGAPSRSKYICARCLRQQGRRLYSSKVDKPPAPPPSGATKVANRRLISLHGPEASKFLQGIVTNNIRSETRTGLFAAFLTAPGKVLNDVFIYPTLGTQWHSEVNKDDEPGYLVEVDGGDVANLTKHVKKHKLRAKLALRLLDEGELDLWSAWREDERWSAHTKNSGEGSTLSLNDCRAPGMGQRLLLPPLSAGSSVAGNTSELADVEEAPLSAYTIRRYLRGVAEGQYEIPREETLPMNANLDLMNGIDFKKGCYIGQELTIRTHHTGVVRRRILPVSLYDAAAEPPSSLSYDVSSGLAQPQHDVDIRRNDKRKRATGKYIAGIGNIGLGMCRLEQMTDLTISGEGSSYTPDDRFTAQSIDDREVGVQAFVPDWIRGQIRGPKIQRRVE